MTQSECEAELHFRLCKSIFAALAVRKIIAEDDMHILLRVSTMKDAQENSLQSQQEYFTEYTQHHPDWVFVGMCTDDGISGLSIRRHDGFNCMVADDLDGRIDLILTKTLSRFARNIVDALTAIRNLKAAGVVVGMVERPESAITRKTGRTKCKCRHIYTEELDAASADPCPYP